MPNYVVTGKLGSGKSLVVVRRIQEALVAGKTVATNLDINLDSMLGKYSDCKNLIRLPDKPTIDDLKAIGYGNTGYDEELNGMLALDELGTWFNARSWNDKSRAPVMDWFLHARKYGWDCYFIVQHVEIIDAQMRKSLLELTAFCKRLDRFNVPVVSTLSKLITGKPVRMPKVHVARVVYGVLDTDPRVDRWVYQARDIYNAYDTKQIFDDNYQHKTYSVLPPIFTTKTKRAERNFNFYVRVYQMFMKRFKVILAACIITYIVAVGSMYIVIKANENKNKENYIPEYPVTLNGNLEPSTDPRVLKLQEMVATLSITGLMSNKPGEIIYQLSSADDRYNYTDRDLAGMGLIVKRRRSCFIEVTVAELIYPIFCWDKHTEINL